MPDDIATYLCLDETVLRRLQRKEPPGWASSSTSPRILVLKLIGEITDSSLTDSTNRLLLFVAAAALACAVVWVALYWASIGRFIESTDDAYVGGEVTTISAKVAGFIDAVTVIDNQSVKAGDLLLKLAIEITEHNSPALRRARPSSAASRVLRRRSVRSSAAG
jgi:hypothetical protein